MALSSPSAAAALVALALSLLLRARTKANRGLPGGALEIEEHIRKTQVPARALGIRVAALDERSLSLSAPLELNKNVRCQGTHMSTSSVRTQQYHRPL